MGLIYKLKPEIKEFILKQKELNPSLSCRKFVSLIEKKFKITLSKSHINSIIKSAGLSSKRGRTPKPKRVIELEGLGIFFLKMVDSLFSGLKYINEVTNLPLPVLEAYIYLYLFNPLRIKDFRWQRIIKEGFNEKKFLSYLNDLQNITIKDTQQKERFLQILQEILAVKLTFFDEKIFYIDAQFHCLWSSVNNIPLDFCLSYCKTKDYIEKIIKEDSPFIFFTSPGYETIPKEWFDFLLRLPYLHNKIVKISFLGGDLREKEVFPLERPFNPFVIFGLWPWQYPSLRKINILTEFKPFYFKALKKDFLITESKIILTQPTTNKIVTFRGIILKLSQESNFFLIIGTNLPQEKASPEEISRLYLEKWPNLKEGFEDFSKRIELFTYHIETHKLMPKDNFILCFQKNPTLAQLLQEYLYLLDIYFRWYFLPLEYRKLDFAITKQRFYELKARLKKEKEFFYLTFKPEPDYPFLKELKLACQRINEIAFGFSDNKRLWFLI